MTTDEDTDRYRAPALDKGLDILELLARADEGLTQAEIAKALGKNPNEFYRMLDRLVRRGYVQRQGGDRFLLTLKLFSLAHHHAPIHRLVSFATPIMQDFAAKAQQACHLAVYDRGSVVVIAQQESPTYWGISIRVGAHISLFNTGSGHILLTYRNAQQRRTMIDEQSQTGDDPALLKELEQRLQIIEKRGFETMDSLQTAGVRNISAPVLGMDGTAIAALTCPYIHPVNEALPSFDACVGHVQEAAHQITAIVGGERDELSQS